MKKFLRKNESISAHARRDTDKLQVSYSLLIRVPYSVFVLNATLFLKGGLYGFFKGRYSTLLH